VTCEQTGEPPSLHQGLIIRYRYRRLWHVGRLSSLAGNTSHTSPISFSAKHLDSTGEPLTSVVGSLGYVAPEVLNHKGHGKPVDLWGYFLSLLIIRWNADYVLQNHYLRTPLRIHAVQSR